jgi:Zn-dependent peptidase ImmA (M78 family)
VLRRLADALNTPEHFFTFAPHPESDDTVYFRSLSSATKTARARAKARFKWRQDIVRYLAEFVEFPRPNLPALSAASDPALLSPDDIEFVAEEARKYWSMGESPIGNVVTLLENQGVIMARDHLGADTLDSLSQITHADSRPYVVIGIDKGTAVRWRFDAAHELGHLLLHTSLDQRRLSRSEEFRRIEDQAHRFAGAFLLPAAEFAEDFFAASLDALRAVKPKWKTSIGVMIKRARQLHLISEDVERKLWMNYGRHKWRRFEPYDDALPAEEPTLLRHALELLMESRDQTPDDISARVGLSLSDVETLCGLQPGFLSGSFTKVSRLAGVKEPRPAVHRGIGSVTELRPRLSEPT